ncbi:MAG: helix-turn-helix transcriptional regulator [Thermomicrobiales bacterium]
MDGTLGTLVRRIRQNAAMSQEVLAERSGVSVRTISDLERGVRSSARFDTIRLLAEALELSAHERSELIEAATSAGTAPYDPVEGRLQTPHAAKCVDWT